MYPAGEPAVRVRMVTLASGLRIRLLEAGSAGAPPVLLIHGWGACVYTFRRLLDGAPAAHRRLIAFDLRGHGLSDKPVGEGAYTTARLVADVIDLLESLRIGRVDLLGHSLGGGLAMRFALAHPARVRRVVLAAPVGLTKLRLPVFGHLLAPRLADRFARFLTPRWLTNLLLRWTYGDPGRVTERDIDEYWAPSQFPNYFRAARALLEEFDWEPLSQQQLARIDFDTLVILSTADRLIRGAESAAEGLPRSEVVRLKGAGHLGIEECAAEFNKAVVEFLDAP